jgi:hypothetical protein
MNQIAHFYGDRQLAGIGKGKIEEFCLTKIIKQI